MIGYKVFENDWTCRDFQYEVGKTYAIEEEPICCERGFHFCRKLAKCFNYYDFDSDNKVAIVEILGDVDTFEDKSCTNKIHILKELTWHEVLEMVNVGSCNTGNYNSGDCNTGNYNSGNYNEGDCNTGYYNMGHYNTGDYNTGHYNTGDYNRGNHNAGCFNTLNSNMTFFNQPSNWTYSDWICSKAKKVLYTMPITTLEWRTSKQMINIEKKLNSTHEVMGGRLEWVLVSIKDKQIWWNNLSNKDKQEVLSLPNFNADIFKQITGINVRPK